LAKAESWSCSSHSTINHVAQTPLGAYAVHAGQAITGNRLDNIADAVGGDGERVRIGTDYLEEAHPVASVAGDMAGQLMVEGIVRGIPGARRFMSTPWGRRATDGVLGAYGGSGEFDADPLAGAVSGAFLGVGGGMAGRQAQRTAGSLLTGVKADSLRPPFMHQLGERWKSNPEAGGFLGSSLAGDLGERFIYSADDPYAYLNPNSYVNRWAGSGEK
jgi:hypothetical protein